MNHKSKFVLAAIALLFVISFVFFISKDGVDHTFTIKDDN